MTREFWNILFFTTFFVASCVAFKAEMAFPIMIGAAVLFLKQWGDQD